MIAFYTVLLENHPKSSFSLTPSWPYKVWTQKKYVPRLIVHKTKFFFLCIDRGPRITRTPIVWGNTGSSASATGSGSGGTQTTAAPSAPQQRGRGGRGSTARRSRPGRGGAGMSRGVTPPWSIYCISVFSITTLKMISQLRLILCFLLESKGKGIIFQVWIA